MGYANYKKQRKPNFKKWTCPFEDKEINSRGVPAYVRNKLKLPWKPEYMYDFELLRKDIEEKADYDSILLNMRRFIDSHLSDDLVREFFHNTTEKYFQTFHFLIESENLDDLVEFSKVIEEWNDLERRKWFAQRKKRINDSRKNLYC